MRQIRGFNHPTAWLQLDDKQIFMSGALGQADGYRMSVGFARLAAGESAPVPAPYDEVWIVTGGRLRLRADDYAVQAQAGELLYVPAGSPGVVEAEDDLELVLVTHPPTWTFQEEDWEAVRTRPRPDARAIRFAAREVPAWEQVDGQGLNVGHVAAEAQDIRIGMGFGHARDEVALDLTFPYDQVVAAIKEGFTIHAEGEQHSIKPGELAYLPAGASGVFQANRGAEVAFVHHPAWDDAVKGWPPEVSTIPPAGDNSMS